MAGLVLYLGEQRSQQAAPERTPDPFRFRTNVEFVNVTATVTVNSRFVPNLQRDDFIVYDNGRRQTVSHFSAERVPVSLGVVLDASGSMAGLKMDAARAALNRFLYDLLNEDDEVFIYTFDDDPTLIEGWTTDRRRVSAGLSRLGAVGGTAMCKRHHCRTAARVDGPPREEGARGHFRRQRRVSHTTRAVKQLIRESEILVYAVGIDSDGIQALREAFPRRRPRRPAGPPPGRWPIPGRPPGRTPFVMPSWQRPPIETETPDPPRKSSSGWVDDRVNVDALRDLTDDSGGRTEIIRDARDLNPATTSIADELSRQDTSWAIQPPARKTDAGTPSASKS